MSKKLITIISIVIVILIAVAVWFFIPKLWPIDQEEESDFGDGVPGLLATLERKTGISFSEAGNLEFNWNILAGKEINPKVILGKGFQADGVSGQEEAKIGLFFHDKGFEVDIYNIAAGTVAGVTGYKKDNMVCLVLSQIWLDENGFPLGENKRDIQVKCGENDNI